MSRENLNIANYHIRYTHIFIFTSFLFFILARTAVPCSTFMLKKGNVFIVGHNLDERSFIPGCIVVNKRGVTKKGITFEELRTGKKDVSLPLTWTSKYGSVTYNPFGRDFPDGGLNEAGLYIGEMTLVETRFPEDETKPKIFMSLWIQYVLDNFESVEQVISSTDEIMLDGWGWHFFIVDSNGNAAAIEFIDGKTLIYRYKKLPVTALCNSTYPDEMKQLAEYEGFGGEKPVVLEDKKTPRFVHVAHMLKKFNPDEDSPVDYGFDILQSLERGGTQWSLVYDVKNMCVYFRTVKTRKIRYVDFNSFNFSCDTPVKMMDIHADLEGDIKHAFSDYSAELNQKFLKTAIENLTAKDPGTEEFLAPGERTPQDLIDNFASYPEHTKCRK